MRRIVKTLRLCTWDSSYLEYSSILSASGKLSFNPQRLAHSLLPLWSPSWVPVCFTVIVRVTLLCLHVWLHKISLLWGQFVIYDCMTLFPTNTNGATDNPHNSALTASSFPPVQRTSRPLTPYDSSNCWVLGFPACPSALCPHDPRGSLHPSHHETDFLLTLLSRAMWGGKMARCSLKFLP